MLIKPFSLTEKMLEMIPEWAEPAAFLVKAVMNAQTFSAFFPELRDFGTRRIDLRCALDKQTLRDGELDEMQMSQLKFKDGNIVEADLHFGCAVWLYDQQIEIPQMQEFMDFVLNLYDDDEEKWSKHRSFYISMGAELEFDFSDGAKTLKIPGQDWINEVARSWNKGKDLIDIPKASENVPLIFGRVLRFTPSVHELKVFKGRQQIHDEAAALNDAIVAAQTHEFWENPYLRPVLELFYGHTLPIAPFPSMEACLGVHAKDSEMAIKEGMAIMSYDFNMKRSSIDCIFGMKDSKLRQEAARLKREQNSFSGQMDSSVKKLFDLADKEVIQKLPPLDIPGLIDDPMFKHAARIVQDENVHKAVKAAFDGAQEHGEKLMKGLSDLGLFGG